MVFFLVCLENVLEMEEIPDSGSMFGKVTLLFVVFFLVSSRLNKTNKYQ